jgi:hypothetical protein
VREVSAAESDAFVADGVVDLRAALDPGALAAMAGPGWSRQWSAVTTSARGSGPAHPARRIRSSGPTACTCATSILASTRRSGPRAEYRNGQPQ